MIKYAIKKIFGSSTERAIRKLNPIVEKINALEPGMKELSDDKLKAFTPKLKERLKQGETLDDLLVDAFAVVRETSQRVLGMRHYDVQLVGGIVLHQGKIAEMKTGEGKTLVATLSAYLNALEGKGVHVVTVNDYLAERDTEWMGEIYKFLGLTVGVILNRMDEEERREAYNCDITYGTNNEFGFDYLRDNMKFDAKDMVQREFHYAIVDEVDSILIDEARTPLIISGPTEKTTSFYYNVNQFIRKLKERQQKESVKYYEVDEKARTAVLTDEGAFFAEEFFNLRKDKSLSSDKEAGEPEELLEEKEKSSLFSVEHMDILHQINQSLKAHMHFFRDKDYVVKDGQVVIVDEFTGRLTPGRRYSDGMHQALEAKEGVQIERESQTYASITFQNYFRMYKKLAGMTGTAATEATEFGTIYGLEVVEIPTNKKLIRKEFPDVIYGSKAEKWDGVVTEIEELHEKGQPVLVGTISIENSELIHRRLLKKKIPHEVLNAKFHDREAAIVAQAGQKGKVTIATNMAGRGTDIVLGGNPAFRLKEIKKEGFKEKPDQKMTKENILKEAERVAEQEHQEVVNLGGLYILGTERHEARRIDNQLRGRSGRQGDPGCSRFFISMEDDLMKILGSDRMKGLLTRVGMSNGVPIENKLVTRAIENAQKQIESQNFSTRKHLLEYDDAMNIQRNYIYNLRREILMGKDVREDIIQLMEDVLKNAFDRFKEQKQTKLKKENKRAKLDEEDEDAEEVVDAIETAVKISDFDLLVNEIKAKFHLNFVSAKIKKDFSDLTPEDSWKISQVFIKEALWNYMFRIIIKSEIQRISQKVKKGKVFINAGIIEGKEEQFGQIFNRHFDPVKPPEQWDYQELHQEIVSQLDIDLNDVKIFYNKYIAEAIEENPGLISRERIINALWNHIETVLEDRAALKEEQESKDTQEIAAKSEADTPQVTKFSLGQIFDRNCRERNDPAQCDYKSLGQEIASGFQADINNIEIRIDNNLKDMTTADFNEIAWLSIREDLWLHILIAQEELTFSTESDEQEEEEPEPDTDSAREAIPLLTEDTFRQIFQKHFDNTKKPDQWDQDGLIREIQSQYNLDITTAKITSGYYIKDAVEDDFKDFSEDEIESSLLDDVRRLYKKKELQIGPNNWRIAERHVMLQVIDSKWKDHLLNIDHLKEGIGLRSYAQKDPLLEFKHESFRLFEEMQFRIGEEVVWYLYGLDDYKYASAKKWKKKKKSILAKPSSKLPTGKKSAKKKKKKKK